MDVRLPDGTMIQNVPDDMSKADLTAKLKSNGYDVSKLEEPASNTAILKNALYKGAAAIPDTLLNAPNNLMNLGKAAYGVATGQGGDAPEPTPNPDYARRGLEAVGLIDPKVAPRGIVQKAIDYGAQGAVGGALTGGASVARSAIGAGMGALSGEAAGATHELTGNPALTASAGLLAPAAAAKVAGGGVRLSPQAQLLADEGVTLTPGQIKGGAVQRAEDAATSLPVLGDAIKSAQRKGIESFDAAALNRALEPIGAKLPGHLKGNQAVEYTYGKLGDAYDSLLPNLKGDLYATGAPKVALQIGGNVYEARQGEVTHGQILNRLVREEPTVIAPPNKPNATIEDGWTHAGKFLTREETQKRFGYDDTQTPAGQAAASSRLSLKQEIENIRQMGQNLPEPQRGQLGRILDREIIDRFTAQGKASGETLKEIESKLGGIAKRAGKSDDYDVRTMGDAVQEAQNAMRRMVENVNPAYQGELAKINQGYANFKKVQNAASKVGAQEGVFTPAQLHAAVRAGDPSKDKARFSEGNALMQDLSTAGKSTLSQTVPDSGTPMRGALMYSLAHPLRAAGLGVPIAAASLPYMFPRLTQRLMTNHRPSLAEVASRSSGPVTAGTLEEILRRNQEGRP